MGAQRHVTAVIFLTGICGWFGWHCQALSPNDWTQMQIREGLRLKRQNEFRAAAQCFSDALKNNPDLFDAYVFRAQCELEMNADLAVIKDIDAAFKLKQTKYAIFAYMCRGEAYRNLAEYDKAVGDYNAAIKLDPKCFAAFAARGRTYLKSRQYDKAVPDLSRALTHSPLQYKYYLERGTAYLELHKYEQALADFNKSIECRPESDAVTYFKRARCQKNLHHFEEALKDYDKGLTLDPRSARSYEERAEVLDKLGKADLARADRKSAQQILQHWGIQ